MKRFCGLSMFFIILISMFNKNCFAGSEKADKKKAVIVVNGAMGSGLFYKGKDNSKYYNNEGLWLAVGENKWRAFKAVSKLLLYKKDLFCDEDGNLVNKDIGVVEGSKFPYKIDMDINRYGVFTMFKNLVSKVNESVSENNGYEVIMHNYDWRLDSEYNAELLYKKIEEYDETIVIGFSLGGLISSRAFVRLEERNELDKIKVFISIAVPYNGSARSLYVLENGMITNDSFMDNIARFIGIPNIVRDMSRNCSSTYQLLPTYNYFKQSNGGYVSTNSIDTLDYEQTDKFIENRKWNKRKNGLNKNFLKRAKVFHTKLYNGDKHIIDKVNTYMILGSGKKTPSKLYVSDDRKSKISIIGYTDGDGTVALKESAMPLGKLNKDKFLIVNEFHDHIVNNPNVLKYISNIIVQETA